jgi:hypothetical protein
VKYEQSELIKKKKTSSFSGPCTERDQIVHFDGQLGNESRQS